MDPAPTRVCLEQMVPAYEPVDCTDLIAQKVISSKLGSPIFIVGGVSLQMARQQYTKPRKTNKELCIISRLDDISYFF